MTTSTGVRASGTGRPGDGASPDRQARRAGAGRDARDRPARIAGLDGLRALAIVAVLVFHLNASWLPGGFLGVDVFFVVSGFLITTLLVREHRATGRIAFRAFWVRRVRRLVPALAVTVTVSVLLARTVSEDLLVHAGRQVAGALTFTTNWVEISAGSSYFDQTAPQLFMNFWSLAVEEQFYLLWPLATLVLVRLVRPARRVGVTLALAAGSTAAMAALVIPGTDPTRVYYGTDTHAMGLMLGAALAFAAASPALALRLRPSTWGSAGPLAVPIAGAVLVALLLVLDEEQAATFRGGIALACLATVVLIAGVLDRRPAAPTAWQRLTDNPVARWIGVRSYSLYLWHWPVILLVAGETPTAPGTTEHLLSRAWCVLVTLALSDLTYRLVETPFRRWGFRQVAGRALHHTLGWSVGARRAMVAGTVAAGLVLAVVLVSAPDESETARMLEANAARAAGGSLATVVGPVTSTGPDPGSGPTGSRPAAAGTATSTQSAPARTVGPDRAQAADFTMPEGREIDGYGDSMMVGSVHALDYYFPGIRMDAKSNRQWSDALIAIRARGADNRRAVVLAFGTNAGVDVPDAEAVISRLGPNRMIVLVNLMGPFSRIDRDNAKLAAIDKEHDNVIVADWADAVRGHPEQLQSDRIHPSLKGSHLFAKVVRQALATLSEQYTGKQVVLKDLPIP